MISVLRLDIFGTGQDACQGQGCVRTNAASMISRMTICGQDDGVFAYQHGRHEQASRDGNACRQAHEDQVAWA